MPIPLTEREFAALHQDRVGQRPPLRVKAGSAWHKRARTLKEGPREPTPIERLAAHGYTRRVSDDSVWFEDASGAQTPRRSTLDAAVQAAMEETTCK
jgi:hypothetical protein